MADTPYQQKFKKALSDAGYSSPKDIPPDKKDDFFNKIDAEHKSKKEKKGDYSENLPITNSRAGSLLRNHLEIEEAFYKTNKGRKHRSRKGNGLDNITPRD